jgi:hypothetical protein
MAHLNGFNAHEVEPNVGFDPIPAGKYLAVITATEMKPTKNGSGEYLQIELEVIEGPHKGRKLWDRLTLKHPNDLTVKIAKGTLSAICRAIGVMAPKDSAFPPPQREKHGATATDEGILSGQVSRWEEDVTDVYYQVHYKRDAPDAKPTLRVEYRCGFNRWYREWICIEHDGYAGQKAAQWWRARSNDPMPETVDEAVDLAHAGALAPALRITIEKKAGEKWERIVGHALGDKPPRLESEEGLPEHAGAPVGIDPGEIPF